MSGPQEAEDMHDGQRRLLVTPAGLKQECLVLARRVVALEAEIAALRGALRRWAVRIVWPEVTSTPENEPPLFWRCDECSGDWAHGQPERHAAGCLAAPTGAGHA